MDYIVDMQPSCCSHIHRMALYRQMQMQAVQTNGIVSHLREQHQFRLLSACCAGSFVSPLPILQCFSSHDKQAIFL